MPRIDSRNQRSVSEYRSILASGSIKAFSQRGQPGGKMSRSTLAIVIQRVPKAQEDRQFSLGHTARYITFVPEGVQITVIRACAKADLKHSEG